MVGLWKEKLAATNQKAAQSLADPAEYENLFPGLQEAVRAEQLLKKERSQLLPASAFPSVTVSYQKYTEILHKIFLLPFSSCLQSPCDRNVLEELRSGTLGSEATPLLETTPTNQEATPTPEAAEEEEEGEDFDLDGDEDLNLDDLDLNEDVSFVVWFLVQVRCPDQ